MCFVITFFRMLPNTKIDWICIRWAFIVLLIVFITTTITTTICTAVSVYICVYKVENFIIKKKKTIHSSYKSCIFLRVQRFPWNEILTIYFFRSEEETNKKYMRVVSVRFQWISSLRLFILFFRKINSEQKKNPMFNKIELFEKLT